MTYVNERISDEDMVRIKFCFLIALAGGTSHSPRRTGITNLADKGVSVRVLQSIARHANISTTQCYIDVNDAMKRKAIELV